MNFAKTVYCWMIFGTIIMAVSNVHAATVNYTLDNVILDDNNAQMFGTFSWTYDVGDFENGVGQFTFLDIPYTSHDHNDLDAEFDIGHSIEITLEGSVHDDGVDITLFLLQPLTPTTGSSIDLVESHYEIGGNGFHDGLFLSGSVVPVGVTGVGDQSTSPESAPAASANTLTTYPNPFNPQTTVTYFVAQPSFVRLSIHDVRGRLVTTLVDQWHASGQHSVPWNGVGLGSGLYFVRYVSGAESRTHKAVLMR